MELIKFLGKLLISKYKNNGTISNVCHQFHFEKDLRKDRENHLDKEERLNTEIDKNRCYDYFNRGKTARHCNKTCSISPWMKTLDPPKVVMNIDSPSNQKTTKVINYIWKSASPGPIDQFSLIIVKNCHITRIILTRIIASFWKNKYFQTKWKNGYTILSNRSDLRSDPVKFKYITLQTAMSKLFTAVIKNRTYTSRHKGGFGQTPLGRLNIPNPEPNVWAMLRTNKKNW